MKKENSIIQGRDKIYEIYDSLVLYNGSNFFQLAKKYSDDKKSGLNGGELDWFGTNKIVKTFEDNAFLLVKKVCP